MEVEIKTVQLAYTTVFIHNFIYNLLKSQHFAIGNLLTFFIRQEIIKHDLFVHTFTIIVFVKNYLFYIAVLHHCLFDFGKQKN